MPSSWSETGAALERWPKLASRLDELESKCDRRFKEVFDALRSLMAPPAAPRRRIGLKVTGRAT
jgi:hypothetical protein